MHARPNESSTNKCFVPAISHGHKLRAHVSHSNVAAKLAGEYRAIAVAEASSVLFTLVLVVCHVAVDKVLSSTNCHIGVSVMWHSDGFSNNVTVSS